MHLQKTGLDRRNVSEDPGTEGCGWEEVKLLVALKSLLLRLWTLAEEGFGGGINPGVQIEAINLSS